MQIDKDPEVFKLLIAIIGFLILILNTISIKFLDYLKKKVNNNEKNIIELKATCKERHLYLGDERRQKKR